MQRSAFLKMGSLYGSCTSNYFVLLQNNHKGRALCGYKVLYTECVAKISTIKQEGPSYNIPKSFSHTSP